VDARTQSICQDVVVGPSERREQRRVEIAGTAWLIGEPAGAQFVIRDLSAEGARLVGRTYVVEGRRVQLVLEVEGERLPVTAEVVRTDPQRAEVAIVFRQLTREQQQHIGRSIDAMLARVRAGSSPIVCLLGAADHEADALERDLARLGHGMRRCGSPADALSALGEGPGCAAVVVASGAAPEAIGELFDRLQHQHPRVKRVVLFGEQLEPVPKDVSRRVDAVLRTPWRIRALARAIGVDAADSTLAMLPTAHDD
jgi:hypothetical protein